MFAPRMTHARRQQYRHRVRSDGFLLAAALVLIVGLSASRICGDPLMVFALLLLGAGLFWRARCSQRLAYRWRVGADSERAVQHALKGLAGSGWVVRDGVPWPGGGDIDHLVRSPAGVGFAIVFCPHLARR
jgi:Nuclease-related domain